MKTNTTKKLILTAVVAALFVAGYVYSSYYILDLVKKTSAMRVETGQKQAAYTDIESNENTLQSVAALKSKIAGYFVPAGGAISFISELERVAAGFGVQYSTQNISEENNDELDAQGKEILRVSFSATGSWKNIMRLVRFVETLPYGLSVDRIDLTSDTGTVTAADASDGTSTRAVVTARRWAVAVSFSVLKTKDNAK